MKMQQGHEKLVTDPTAIDSLTKSKVKVVFSWINHTESGLASEAYAPQRHQLRLCSLLDC